MSDALDYLSELSPFLITLLLAIFLSFLRDNGCD
jgi:hypothetical protein